ncbi:hypothetical protein [Candidatus Poriferisodalis sp.]|uniref:hypothetical protein n=1 Tax=Candidatus Poriferisodalis sp. TaxID=3101277 RepID=UPI003B58C5F7
MSRASQRITRSDSGLASLEWLLIIAAVGGLAAVMSVAFQRILDDAAESTTDPTARLLEANVVAAEVANDAAAAQEGTGLDPDGPLFAELSGRCEQIAVDFDGAVLSTVWTAVPSNSEDSVRWTCQVQGR